MRWISTRPLFAKPITWDFWPGYLIDFLLLGHLWVAALAAGTLRAFASAPLVSGTGFEIAIIGGLGIWGFRLAMWIALFRRNRRPQMWEWRVTLVGLGVALFFLLTGRAWLREWARARGFHECAAAEATYKIAVFARTHTPCPARDPGELAR